MNKGMAGYVLVFMLLISAGIVLGNQDPITPAIMEARAETSTGPVIMSAINQGLSFGMKLLMGATIAGVLSFVWVEGGKWYRKLWSEQLTRRWKPGPNAQFQQQQKMPRLTREDVLLMALANRDGRVPRFNSTRVPRGNNQEADNEIDISL